MPNFPAGAPAKRALRRLTRSARRRPLPDRPRVSAAAIEEEAANLLYGRRSGMVNASPVGPPLEEPLERRP